jgi:hypothetical protein
MACIKQPVAARLQTRAAYSKHLFEEQTGWPCHLPPCSSGGRYRQRGTGLSLEMGDQLSRQLQPMRQLLQIRFLSRLVGIDREARSQIELGCLFLALHGGGDVPDVDRLGQRIEDKGLRFGVEVELARDW